MDSKKTQIRAFIEDMYPEKSKDEVTQFLNRYMSGIIDLDGKAMNPGINEGIAADVETRRRFQLGRANGGRIGFDNGGFSLGPAEEMQMLMKRLMDEGGMSEKDAAQEAEKMLFGPSAMKLRDSKKGIGSMMAAADDDEYKSPPFLDDPEGRMSTDELEAIMQIMQEGRLSELEDSDQFMIYDLLLEKDMLPDGIDSFEDFKRMYSGQDSMMASRRGSEGIMQMVG